MTARRTKLLWTAACALGTLAGALAAVAVVPSGGFARTPTGQLGDHLVVFAVVLGMVLAIPQWALLRHLALSSGRSDTGLLLLWGPAVCVGFVLMLLPLYSVDASDVIAPWILVPAVLPGVFGLGLAQWYVLKLVFPVPFSWVGWTLAGTVLGAIIGAFVGVLFGSPETLIFGGGGRSGSMEAIWGLVTGLFMGLAQAGTLVKAVRG